MRIIKFYPELILRILSLISIIFIAGFFLFWKISVIPPLTGGVAPCAYSTYLLFKSLITKTSFYELTRITLQNVFGREHRYLMMAEINFALYYPLFSLWQGLFYSIFGLNKFAINFSSACVGFVTLLANYYYITKIFGKKHGFISIFLLSTSIVYLIFSRCHGWHICALLFISLSLYCFYQGVAQKRHQKIWLGGALLGIGLFNGYPPILVTCFILFIWLIWVYKGISFFKNRHLWISGALAMVVFLLFTIIFSLVFTNNPLESLKNFFDFLTVRSKNVLLLACPPSFIFKNILMAFKNIFISMLPFSGDWYGPSDSHQVVVGRPIINPLISLFFIWGIILAFKKDTPKDKFILSWLGVVLFICAFLIEFETRYFLLATPALAIIVSCAMVHFISLMKRSDLRDNNKIHSISKIIKNPIGIRELASMVFIFIALFYNSYITYKDYFITYAHNDAYLWRYIGSEEIAQYIKKTTPPQECRIIFSNKKFIPYGSFPLITDGRYPVQWWNDIVATNKEDILNLQQWEKNVLNEDIKVIFYVFSLDNNNSPIPGKPKNYRGPYDDISLFKRLHPHLKPAKIVYSTSGLPVFAIYEARGDRPLVDYDYNIGTLERSRCVQTFLFEYPILEKLGFRIKYVGERSLLPDLIIELHRVKEGSSLPDMTEGGLLTSLRVSPLDLNLENEEYSIVPLTYLNLNPKDTYAIIWKQERIDNNNHYVLARQNIDIYDNGRSGYYDRAEWIMSDIDIDIVPIKANYRIESTTSKGISVFEIPRSLDSSEIEYKIVFNPETWEKNIFDQQNLICLEDNDRKFLWVRPKTSSGGYLVYKIESPYIIKTIKTFSNPRIDNDFEKKNFLRFSYSIDGIKYYKVYELSSKGYGGMTGIGEEPMHNTIQPGNKTVYLRFDFSEESAQLWATKEVPMTFNIKVGND